MRILIVYLLASFSFARGADCDSLVKLKLASTSITSAATVAAGTFAPPSGNSGAFPSLPDFCRVRGVIKPSADSHIEFEVWMPSTGWNGRYQGVGNGGFAGSISYGPMAAALAAGYAVSATDTGHQAGGTDATWAMGHYEKILDYGYRAIHETAEKSKSVIRAMYGSDPKYSFFNGCSNGGRQALLEAQRYPADYDGILAGAPANYFTHHFAGFLWNMRALENVDFPSGKVNAIEAAAIAACDLNDGVKDGVIDDPSKCKFDPAVLHCLGQEDNTCLTDAQIAALKKIYEGPHTSSGVSIFPGYEPGGESGGPGWGAWILGYGSNMPSVQSAFGKGFFGAMVYQDPAWDYRKFSFDDDMAFVDDKAARIVDATNPNLKAFKDRGGKLIIYHGWSDSAIAPRNAIHYYESVVAKMGPAASNDFVQLYMVPGMQHCAGGPGPSVFGADVGSKLDREHNIARALEEWVEKGAAPTRIIAAKYKTEGRPASGVLRTRPLCPYPQVARYKGSGSTDDAANFTCAAN
jgi:hypothetical protein